MLGQVARVLSIFMMGLMMLLLPAWAGAEPDQTNAAPPSIGQPLVREGDFAVKLAKALTVGVPQDEIEAENLLTEVGIAPKNGWIADYPVTPDIVDELYKAVRDAAASEKIPLSVDVAFQRMNDVMAEAGLSIATPSGGKTLRAESSGAQNYPNTTVINNYYQTEGPPTITYYTPPPDYYYMYGWVPSPFWCAGIWFPGFFILNDFHRTVFIDNRVVFVSNHFRDIRGHRIVRIDPVTRFNGSVAANTRVVHGRGVDPAIGASRVRAIGNEPRMQAVPGSNAVIRQPRSSSAVAQPPNNGTRFSMPNRDNRAIGASVVRTRSEAVTGMHSRGEGMINPSARSGSGVAPRMERSFVPSGNRAVFSVPSRGAGFFDRATSRGMGAFGGRGRR